MGMTGMGMMGMGSGNSGEEWGVMGRREVRVKGWKGEDRKDGSEVKILVMREKNV